MQRKKYRRVNFRISNCSSEDPEYPVSELLLQSPNCRGWQTKRFCQYPQTIMYELVEPTILKQISVLSHQSKITTKIIIQTKVTADGDWSRLGYISLDSNASTNYQSRELKTVNVKSIHSQFLKFTIESNYVNNHNLFNQVGIISLCVYGDSLREQEEKPQTKGNFGMDLDKNTMNKLKQLEIEKKQAIDEEDFDRATVIKKQIERIKNLGQTLMLLEEKKKKAVENQNYEDAKIINEKIKKLRDSEGGGPNFTTRPSGTPSDYFRPKKYQEPPEEEQSQPPSISPMTQIKRSIFQPQKTQTQAYQDNDDRPINVTNKNPYEQGRFDDQDEQQHDSSEPQQLSKQLKGECMEHFSAFDQYTFRCLFSSVHAHRQKGLGMVRDEIANGRGSKIKVIDAFFYVIRKMIDDKNAAVLLQTLDLFGIGLRKLKPEPIGSLVNSCDYILQKMNDYLGHTNEKIRRLTEDIYISLPTYKITSKDVCYRALTVLGKREKPPKILVGRLKMLTQIVNNFQLGKNYEQVITFATKYADDKNGDVRNASVTLICTIANQTGYTAVQPFLKNLRPKILQTIQQKFQEKGGMDNRNYDQRPIRTKQTQKQQHLQEMQNQFIEVQSRKNHSQNQEHNDQVCEFCERFDPKFENQDYKDLHLYNACPMLMICQECKQAVQISTLTAHLLSECSNSKYFKKCPRCKQAVHQRSYKAHVQKKECLPAKPLASANRCPLCHLDIPPGKNGWRIHLAEQGCDNNPRK